MYFTYFESQISYLRIYIGLLIILYDLYIAVFNQLILHNISNNLLKIKIVIYY